MQSFYGGPQGQSFKISAIFPNRVALAEDLKNTAYSPVKLNEFVMISYGMQNLDEKLKEVYKSENDTYYNENRQLDEEKYEQNYNATLWQKVYKEDLKEDEETKVFWYKNNKYAIAALEEGNNSNQTEISELSYCYICISDLSGNTPEIGLKDTITLDPADAPQVDLDITNIDYPKFTFNLPRAVKFHWLDKTQLRIADIWDNSMAEILSEDILNQIGIGDIIVNTENGKLYTVMEKPQGTGSVIFKNGCEIDLVPNFVCSLERIPGYNEFGAENLTKVELTNDNFTGTNPEYSIDFTIPETITPAQEGHIISYDGFIPNGKTSIDIQPKPNSSEYILNMKIPQAVSINDIYEIGSQEGPEHEYLIVLNNGTKSLQVKDGKSIQSIEYKETKNENNKIYDIYTIQYNYGENTEFQIERLKGEKGDSGQSLQVSGYLEIEDTRTEEDTIKEDWVFVKNYLNTNYPSGIINNINYKENPNYFILLNLYEEGETMLNPILTNSFLGWFDTANSWWWVVNFGSNNNSNATELEWIDLD